MCIRDSQSSNQKEISKAVSTFLDSIDRESVESKKLDAASVAAVLREMVDFGYFQLARNLGLTVNAATPELQTTSPTSIPQTTDSGLLAELDELIYSAAPLLAPHSRNTQKAPQLNEQKPK